MERKESIQDVVNAEAVYLYRLARKAEKHQCSAETIEILSTEAEALRTSLRFSSEKRIRKNKGFRFAFRRL